MTEAADSDVGLKYAKDQLGVKPGECGLLGLRWNKENDKIAVTFPKEVADPTKRDVLGKIAKIYDPIGLAAPVTLEGKIIYCDICKEKTAWDAELPLPIAKKWSKWENNLPDQVEVPRALALAGEDISEITLHSFGDACKRSSSGCLCSGSATFSCDAGTRRSKGTPRQRRSYHPQTGISSSSYGG